MPPGFSACSAYSAVRLPAVLPANEILDFADKNDIGLIIISAYGRTGPGRWAMGSITHKVLQRSRVPALLIRTSGPETALDEKELRKILVPLDGSRFAEAVIPYVEGLAWGDGQ